MSNVYQSLSHSRWDCKYHVVFIPNGGGRCYLEESASNLGKFFMLWPGRRNARFWKGI